jgi:hypothetical protein
MANAQTELEAANKKNTAKSKLQERLAKKKIGGAKTGINLYIFSLINK